MQDGTETRFQPHAIARRLFVIVGLVAVGTPAVLWLVAEIYAPRDLRSPESAPVVEISGDIREHYHPIVVVDPQPAVSGFEVLTREEADRRLDDAEMVLAVTINNQSRAWPLNVMTGPRREVFNDELGGRAIAATW